MRWAVMALALVSAGCATSATPVQDDDPFMFARVDCRSMAANPSLIPEFERAKASCFNKASLTAEQLSAGYGILSSQIIYNSANSRLIVACMADYGFLWRRKSELAVLCPVSNR